MQQRGLFQSLAEPNLVAQSGKEASFLAGGEFPVPIAQGSGANLAISVMFKEFGVRLNFTPTINGDRVNLKVRPEVSTLDFGNAVVLNGFRIPALSTRRTETEIELRNGQTFAIAGLLNNQMQSTMQKIPGIGDIPILGYLFRSKVASKEQTELVVMITPEILQSDSVGVTNTLPRTPDTFMPPVTEKQAKPPLPPAFGPQSRSQADAVPVPAPALKEAGRTLDASERAALAAAQQIEAQQRAAAEQQRLAEQQRATPQQVEVAPAKQAEVEVQQHSVEQKRIDAMTREQAEQAERDAELAEKAQKEERKQLEKLAKEQAKRDAQAAKEKAKADKAAAEEAKKREAEEKKQAEEAKRQAALLQERQQEIDAAAERLRATEAAYQAELAKRSSR